MPRSPVEINQTSACSLAKWRIQQRLKGKVGFMEQVMLQQAIKDGGAVDEIAQMLYDMGIRLSIDKDNPEHKAWLDQGAAIPTEE